MKTESILVKCDRPGCKSFCEIESKHTFPAGWFRVGIVKEDGTQSSNGFDLCSALCVEKWGKARKEVRVGVKAPVQEARKAAEGTHPCGLCDYVGHTIQGLRLHERQAHGYNAKYDKESEDDVS